MHQSNHNPSEFQLYDSLSEVQNQLDKLQTIVVTSNIKNLETTLNAIGLSLQDAIDKSSLSGVSKSIPQVNGAIKSLYDIALKLEEVAKSPNIQIEKKKEMLEVTKSLLEKVNVFARVMSKFCLEQVSRDFDINDDMKKARVIRVYSGTVEQSKLDVLKDISISKSSMNDYLKEVVVIDKVTRRIFEKPSIDDYQKVSNFLKNDPEFRGFLVTLPNNTVKIYQELEKGPRGKFWDKLAEICARVARLIGYGHTTSIYSIKSPTESFLERYKTAQKGTQVGKR